MVVSGKKKKFVSSAMQWSYKNCTKLILEYLTFMFLPDPRGDGLDEAFQISSVRPYVSTLDFSFILHAQFTSDPQYFYRFRTSYVLTIRGADPKFPRPP